MDSEFNGKTRLVEIVKKDSNRVVHLYAADNVVYTPPKFVFYLNGIAVGSCDSLTCIYKIGEVINFPKREER